MGEIFLLSNRVLYQENMELRLRNDNTLKYYHRDHRYYYLPDYQHCYTILITTVTTATTTTTITAITTTITSTIITNSATISTTICLELCRLKNTYMYYILSIT